MAYEMCSPSGEYAQAMRTVNVAKWLLLIVVLLSLLAAVKAVCIVSFTHLLDSPASATSTMPATAPAEPSGPDRSATWRYWLGVSLGIARVVGPLACLMLLATLALACGLSLLNRSGGTAKFVSSFFWSLLLLVMLTPWQSVFGEIHAAGAIPSLAEIRNCFAYIKPGQNAAWFDVGTYYARFLAYPVVALLVWLAVTCKFSCGYKAMAASTSIPLAPPDERPASPEPRV